MAINWNAVETQKGWSTEDQARYAQNKKEWDATDDPLKKQLLNDENTRLRKKYGVESDTFGAADAEDAYKYNVQMGNSYLHKGASLDFDVDKSGVNKAREAIENFSYNPEEDAAFKAYRDMAHREGTSAAKSTLNQLNAATMGRNNSFSSAATAQVQQAYAQKVADKAVELADIAYQKLLDRYNIEKAEYEAEYGRRQDEYNRNMDIADRSMNRYVTAEQHGANMEQMGIQNDILGYDRDTYHQRLESDMADAEASRRATIAGAVGQEKANARYDEVVDAELEQMKANTQETYNDVYGDEVVNMLYANGFVKNGYCSVYDGNESKALTAEETANLLKSGYIDRDASGNLYYTDEWYDRKGE